MHLSTRKWRQVQRLEAIIEWTWRSHTIAECIKALKHDHIRQLFKEELVKKAMQEADALLPHLGRLNAGKGFSEGGGQGFSALKKRFASGDTKPSATETELKESVQAFHGWLSQERSALRGMLSVLDGNRAFCAGHVAEKVARGWVTHKLA